VKIEDRMTYHLKNCVLLNAGKSAVRTIGISTFKTGKRALCSNQELVRIGTNAGRITHRLLITYRASRDVRAAAVAFIAHRDLFTHQHISIGYCSLFIGSLYFAFLLTFSMKLENFDIHLVF
jgi:hypothetical protein